MSRGSMSGVAPEAVAYVFGSDAFPAINGKVCFYRKGEGTIVAARVNGLPQGEMPCGERVFGFHVHQGASCSGTPEEPFANAIGHYNPYGCMHPQHAGDLPPLFGDSKGYAMTIFYTDRFVPEEVIGRVVIIHDNPDDFKTQPSGNSGAMIACGEIMKSQDV